METKLYFNCVYKKNEKLTILADDLLAETITTDEMLNMLEYVRDHDGGADLSFYPEPDEGSIAVDVWSDGEKYYFTMSDNDDKSYLCIRTKRPYVEDPKLASVTEEFSNGKMIYFKGEPFPLDSVITDFDFIKKVFAIFLENNGDVPWDMMA